MAGLRLLVKGASNFQAQLMIRQRTSAKFRGGVPGKQVSSRQAAVKLHSLLPMVLEVPQMNCKTSRNEKGINMGELDIFSQ